MASITQDPEKTGDPSYIGLSQGTDRARADTSMGELFTNIAQLGGGALKATHGFMTDKIESDLQSKIEGVRTDAGVYGATDLAESGVAPTSVQGEANIFDTSNANVKAGKGNPAGVARLGQNVSGLQDAYDQGKLSESYYNARLLSIVREAKSQHPGFKDEIDAIVQKTTGINPANALVRSLRADMDAAERARQAGASKDETYLKAHLQFMTQETREKIIKGDRSPSTVAQAYTEASGNQARAFTVEQANHQLTLDKNKGEWDDVKGLKTAQLTVSEYVSNGMTAATNAAGGADGIMEKIRAHGDKPWSPDEQKAIQLEMGKLKTQITLGVDNILAQPQYAQLSEDKKKQVREAAIARVGAYEQALMDKNTGVLTANARYNESIVDADMRRILQTNEFARKAAALAKIGGAGAGELLKGTLTDAAGLKTYVKSINDLNQMELITGEGDIQTQVKRTQAGAKDVPELNDPKGYKAHIDNAVYGLVNAKDPKTAENFAKGMFSPKTIGFLSNYKPSSQQQVFRALTSPAVDLKMVEIGKTNPEVYKNYRDWVVSYGFQTQSKRAIDTVNEVHTDQAAMANITQDPKSGLFRAELKPEFQKKGFFTTSGSSSDPIAGVQKAIGELNQNIMVIKPILAREGGDPVAEVGKVLQANGWDPNAPKKPGFVQSLGNAISETYNSLTGESKLEKGIKTPQGLDYQLDGAPTGKPRRPETDDTTSGGISLDSGTLQDVSSKSQGIKKLIRGAESSDNYDLVYGTKRDIPVTKMTVDEALDLQTKMKKAGSPSTAIGGYQFIQGTLKTLKAEMGLKGDEIMDKKLQDRMADVLLARRGFGKYLAGEMGHKELVDSIAKEWAGLPTTKGKSFYEGDGLNHSNVKLRPILDELKTLRTASADTVELMPRSKMKEEVFSSTPEIREAQQRYRENPTMENADALDKAITQRIKRKN